MRFSKKTKICSVICVIGFFVLAGIISKNLYNKKSRPFHSPDIEMVKKVEKKIRIITMPEILYSYSIMKKGVIQHLDRNYTYDVIPEEITGGFVFQGIHRPPRGTVIHIEVLEPGTLYFFFHAEVDGGYGEIFKKLPGWVKCQDAPKYDINNGEHGLNMIMYHLNAERGTYFIPPTTKERACYNIVYK